ncbi:hypothetical protein E8E14_013504 [Neopestalotiopsis sp. 37M]|nr:hypothetical protein E8E14_013504 [Neopestalotiopsis sp. 37M]
MRSCTFPIDRGAAADRTVSAGTISVPDTSSASSRVATTATSHVPDGGDSSASASGRTEPDLRPPDNDLSDSVMRTMISSSNDALDVLFDPVRRGSQVMTQAPSISDGPPSFSHGTSLTVGKEATVAGTLPRLSQTPSNSVREIWNACRFVKQGWFSAGEAVFLVDKYSRIQKLLYIYVEQVSLQHGRQTFLPQGIVRQTSRVTDDLSQHDTTNTLLKAWSEITKLARLIMETIYPSAAHTSQLLQTGRYHNLMDHFQPMLLIWEDKYLSQSDIGSDFYRHFLRIEYFSTRLYCYSVGLQGIIERNVLQNGSRAGSSEILAGEILDANDYHLVEEVVKCSSEVLRSAVHLGDHQVLQNVPTRVTLRIISGSIFLMKSLGIGIGATKLHASLDLLQKAISALGSNAVDELQLGHRYAALLEMHLSRLQSYLFSNGCRITHGLGANVKKPFAETIAEMDLTMHELTAGHHKGFAGQLGFIEFNTDIRLPRHVHMDLKKQRLTDERIMVLHGAGMVEIAGGLYVVAPGSLVDAIGGVPHTWTACPPGVRLPDGSVSTGTFTMVYEYEEPTAFFPTASTEPITSATEYKEFTGNLDDIRFPVFNAREVVERAHIVFNKELLKLELA